MASPKIFLSSTCYDLSLLRGQLRNFIQDIGYDPVMSDYFDILYDHRTHTHTSCIKEIPHCDAVVLVVGSRFGGKGIPEAIAEIDFESVAKASLSSTLLEKQENLSITQLEILTAVQKGIPVYAFVDEKVLHDHHIYEANKNSGIVEKIKFPSIEKQETARFIFEFINFLRLRTRGNSVYAFAKHEDIESTLKKQWAGYFQRLMYEERHRIGEERRIDNMSEQFESLKSAILASIPNVDTRSVARTLVRYRRLMDILLSFDDMEPEYMEMDASLPEVLAKCGVVNIAELVKYGRARTVFVCQDGTFYNARIPVDIDAVVKDWEGFRMLPNDTKRVVIETSLEMIGDPVLRHVNEKFEDAVKEAKSEEESSVSMPSLHKLLRSYEENIVGVHG